MRMRLLVIWNISHFALVHISITCESFQFFYCCQNLLPKKRKVIEDVNLINLSAVCRLRFGMLKKGRTNFSTATGKFTHIRYWSEPNRESPTEFDPLNMISSVIDDFREFLVRFNPNRHRHRIIDLGRGKKDQMTQQLSPTN